MYLLDFVNSTTIKQKNIDNDYFKCGFSWNGDGHPICVIVFIEKQLSNV